MKKIISLVTALSIAAWSCLPACARAADIEISNAETISSDQYVGEGNLQYLNDKIQAGYYVPEFSKIDNVQNERVNKRNNIENLVQNSFKAAPESFQQVEIVKDHQDYAAYQLTTEFQKAEKNAVAVLSAHNIDTYIPYSDGSVQYFQDGLLMMVTNSRVVDEYGNVSRKDMFNMEYTENRLLKSYETTITDNLGNLSKQKWEGAYTDDSVFWGGDASKANKHYKSYTVTETDHNGNITTTQWEAGTYEGKYLRDYTQNMEEQINGTESNTKFTRTSSLHRFNIEYYAPGVVKEYDEQGQDWHKPGSAGDNIPYTYELHRSDLTYNTKGQTTGYHEERSEIPAFDTTKDYASYFTEEGKSQWTTTVSDVTLEYLDAPSGYGNDVEEDPSRLKSTRVVSTTTQADGGTRTETSTTTYSYDKNFKLIGGTGESTFNGKASKWIEYKDAAGNDLTREEKDGVVKYYYWTKDETDPSKGVKTYVEEANVTATTRDGNRYSGTSTTTYEIVGGKPLAGKVESSVTSYGADDKTIVSTENSTTTYTYGLVNNNISLLSTVEKTTSNQPELDPDKEYQTTKEMTTTYTYDNLGNLHEVKGTGTENGWDYSDDAGFKDPYKATITTTYEVTLGRSLLKYTDESRAYYTEEEYKNVTK
ncbi:MAG TPA: hypothetical protein P5110_00925 [Candidatus Omnitrophota bacterium]|nr:hypothetical protein [Candidatus Omnitrophota bacterium]